MVQAIGSSVTANSGGTRASSSVLDAQLSSYQRQLADWCNCPSGKTPEGKAKIRELQDKADAVKTQLQRIAVDRPQEAPGLGASECESDFKCEFRCNVSAVCSSGEYDRHWKPARRLRMMHIAGI